MLLVEIVDVSLSLLDTEAQLLCKLWDQLDLQSGQRAGGLTWIHGRVRYTNVLEFGEVILHHLEPFPRQRGSLPLEYPR